MPRMIDLIRASAVPSNLMQAAARGALAVPPGEMIEILVHLAIHNKVFGEQAKLTLAGWSISFRQRTCDPRCYPPCWRTHRWPKGHWSREPVQRPAKL